VKSSKFIENAISKLTLLPGIGRKSASRIVFYLITLKATEIEALADSIYKLKDNIRFCKICGGISDNEVCYICTDINRKESLICVVEGPKDIINIENASSFKGKYHVLGGVISPLDGVSPDDLHIKSLLKRCKNQHVEEIIIATNPTIEGDATAQYIAELVKPSGIKVMRIARGIPMGSDIEYADIATISKSIDDRIEI
jgi:recombination protein RecR